MASPDQLLSEFIDHWNAGRRPRVEHYLERVEPDQRAALAAQIADWLEIAPRPEYDAATLEEIRREPGVAEAVGALDTRAGLWPALLPRLRRQAKLGLDEVAARLTETLGLAGREEKTRGYLEQMESGALDPTGVSIRVLDALARLLGSDREELERAGDLGAQGARAAPALLRAEDRDADLTRQLEVLGEALTTPAPSRWDEVDELFRGGR